MIADIDDPGIKDCPTMADRFENWMMHHGAAKALVGCILFWGLVYLIWRLV